MKKYDGGYFLEYGQFSAGYTTEEIVTPPPLKTSASFQELLSRSLDLTGTCFICDGLLKGPGLGRFCTVRRHSCYVFMTAITVPNPDGNIKLILVQKKLKPKTLTVIFDPLECKLSDSRFANQEVWSLVGTSKPIENLKILKSQTI